MLAELVLACRFTESDDEPMRFAGCELCRCERGGTESDFVRPASERARAPAVGGTESDFERDRRPGGTESLFARGGTESDFARRSPVGGGAESRERRSPVGGGTESLFELTAFDRSLLAAIPSCES